MPSIQRFELSLNDTIKLLTREPLLIVRLPILKPGLQKTMRPERKKPYQDRTFALHNPLELDNDDLDLLKLDHLSWMRLLGEVLQIAPLYSTMGETLFKHIFTYPWSQYIWQASSIWSLLDSILNLRFGLINSRTTSSFSTMVMSWRFTWELTQSYSSRHTQASSIWYLLDSILNLRFDTSILHHYFIS
jgi:hypothetical protein